MKNNHFNHIAGYEKEKKSLGEIADLMCKSDLLASMGIRLPRGVLLLGEPGVGKTVMAEALIAGSGLPCVRVDEEEMGENDSLSDYLKAKASAAMERSPCILFADELDKLLGTASPHGMSFDMENTRAFLRMIDSLAKSNVVLLATANDEHMLNRAVCRSGRFDRVIHIGLPDIRDRQAILRHYTAGKPMSGDVNLPQLARTAVGMSGADLECLVNEAGLRAVGQGRKRICRADMEYALDCKRFRGVEQDSGLPAEELRVVAVHEAGHALMTWVLHPDDLAGITIKPIGESQGHVMNAESGSLPTRAWVENQLAILYAGRTAERLTFPDVTYLGSSDDLTKAFRMAGRLVTSEGIFGASCLVPEADNPFEQNPMSEAKQQRVEQLTTDLLETASRRAEAVLSANVCALAALADKLLQVGTLTGEDAAAFLSGLTIVNPEEDGADDTASA